MQWLSKEGQCPLYTQLILQEGRGQWETVERKSKQRCLLGVSRFSKSTIRFDFPCFI